MNHGRGAFYLSLLSVLLAGGCVSRFANTARERPGLGTAWGETRSSPVRIVPFERDDPHRPAAVATLHYDDARGLRAQLDAAEREDASWSGGGLSDFVHVRLLDSLGRPLPRVRRHARDFVEGRQGERYTIEIANRSDVRVEVVVTVDGLDVLDGTRGAVHRRGYLVGAGSSLRIDGFRQNDAEVAAFRFGSVADSYAAQQGDDANVGVIAAAFFPERGWALDRTREAARRRAADPFPGAYAQPPADRWY